jgi:transcriptional regulator with XRE-family HTH domain
LDITLPDRRKDAANAPIPSTPPVDVGQRLRTLRRERSWTLLQASQQTGLSLSALSKIERGELSPTLSSLNKVAAGFAIDIVSLLDEATPATAPGRRQINRRASGTAHPTGTCQNTWLGTDLRNKRMLPILTQVTARDPAEYAEWANHAGEIFLYVLSGTLVVHSRLYEPAVLEAHDSMYYDASADSKWTSRGKDDAEVLWVYA